MAFCIFVVAILPQYYEKLKNMVTYYNKKDLLSFGKYLLSDERTLRIQDATPEGIELSDRLKEVYHADIENWKNPGKEPLGKLMADLDHFCSYTGITSENKQELMSIITAINDNALDVQKKALIAIAKVEGVEALEKSLS